MVGRLRKTLKMSIRDGALTSVASANCTSEVSNTGFFSVGVEGVWAGSSMVYGATSTTCELRCRSFQGPVGVSGAKIRIQAAMVMRLTNGTATNETRHAT